MSLGSFLPVVPGDKARIKVQLATTHSKEQLGKAITTFVKVGTV
jgi:7-keto-8-aminopelargonate synthetase-like enzyme